MKQTLAFTEGVGAGAGVILIIAALVFLTRARALTTGRSVRPRFGRTVSDPANYLDLCRTAGL